MDNLLQWQAQIRRANRKKWNQPPTLKIDKSGIEYARRKRVSVIYVDIDTGEIMQFGTSKSVELHSIQWDGMFPYRRMKAIHTVEYEKFIEELKHSNTNNYENQ